MKKKTRRRKLTKKQLEVRRQARALEKRELPKVIELVRHLLVQRPPLTVLQLIKAMRDEEFEQYEPGHHALEMLRGEQKPADYLRKKVLTKLIGEGYVVERRRKLVLQLPESNCVHCYAPVCDWYCVNASGDLFCSRSCRDAYMELAGYDDEEHPYYYDYNDALEWCSRMYAESQRLRRGLLEQENALLRKWQTKRIFFYMNDLYEIYIEKIRDALQRHAVYGDWYYELYDYVQDAGGDGIFAREIYRQTERMVSFRQQILEWVMETAWTFWCEHGEKFLEQQYEIHENFNYLGFDDSAEAKKHVLTKFDEMHKTIQHHFGIDASWPERFATRRQELVVWQPEN